MRLGHTTTKEGPLPLCFNDYGTFPVDSSVWWSAEWGFQCLPCLKIPPSNLCDRMEGPGSFNCNSRGDRLTGCQACTTHEWSANTISEKIYSRKGQVILDQ